jgi:hypothetical protein
LPNRSSCRRCGTGLPPVKTVEIELAELERLYGELLSAAAL